MNTVLAINVKPPPAQKGCTILENVVIEIKYLRAWCVRHGRGRSHPLAPADYVDSAADKIFFTDASCSPLRNIETATFGSGEPTGVAYIPTTNQLVITDSEDDEIYFVNYDTGVLEGQCDTLSLGMAMPSGIDYINGQGLLALTDEADEALILLDTSCGLVSQRSTGTLEPSSLNTNVTGTTYNHSTGTFIFTDSSSDALYVSDSSGRLEWKIDTYSLGLQNPRGVASLGNGDLLIVDQFQTAVYHLSIPLLTEPQSLSGLFVPDNGGFFPTWIQEQGGGHFTGTILGIVPVFGYIDYSNDTVSLAVHHPVVRATYHGVVSEDLGTISFPDFPLGNLVRF